MQQTLIDSKQYLQQPHNLNNQNNVNVFVN